MLVDRRIATVATDRNTPLTYRGGVIIKLYAKLAMIWISGQCPIATFSEHLFGPSSGGEYCDKRVWLYVCLSVCLSVCLFARTDIPGTT